MLYKKFNIHILFLKILLQLVYQFILLKVLTIIQNIDHKNSVIKQEIEPYVQKIIQYLDNENGGFIGAPKFPQFYIFQTLLYFYNFNKNKKFIIPVEKLLSKISSRGIYDHLRGGISRYAVDERWIIPHFEKMLYDNIQFISLLCHYLKDHKSDYLEEKLKQTINFINEEFISPDNLLGSALDADSEGVEGKYYIWDYNEIKNILKDKFDVFKKYYDISLEGNFENLNILVEKDEILPSSIEKKNLNIAKRILLDERQKRVKPFFDNKVQTDLNCYWFYVNIYASLLLNDDNLYNKTIESIKRLTSKLGNEIYHCYNKKDNKVKVFLEDYTYLSLLYVTLYEINNDKKSLEKCIYITEKTWELFFNKRTNLLQKNILDNNDLFTEPVDISDNNIPNGNSIYLMICNKLKNITNNKCWKDKIELLSRSFHSYINSNYSQMFSYFKIMDICEKNITVTIYGKFSSEKNFIKKLNTLLMGDATVIYKETDDEFFTIICQNETCSSKLKSPIEIIAYLKKLNYV